MFINKFYSHRSRRLLEKLLITSIFTFIFANPLLAKDEILPPTSQDATQSSVDEEINKVYLSFPFELPPELKGKVESNADFAIVVAQSYRDFVDANGRFGKWKNVPNSKKMLVISRYEIGDARVRDAILYAKSKGIKIKIISDGNIYYEKKEDFVEKQKYSSDFANAKWNSSPMAKILQDLVAAGFKIKGEGRYTIDLAPLQNTKLMKIGDIYHHKHDNFVICKNEDCTEFEDALWQEGSFNAVANDQNIANPRINMHVEHNSREGALYTLKQALGMAQNFHDEKSIGELGTQDEFKHPLELIFTDKNRQQKDPYRTTSEQISFTNGQQNPNRLIAQKVFYSVGLNDDGDEPTAEQKAEMEKGPKIEVEKIWFLHFAPTYKRGFSAMKRLLEKNPKTDIWVFADGQFIDPLGFGLLQTMFGWPALPPFNAPMSFPFSSKLLKHADGSQRVTGFIFQAPNPHELDKNPDGAPTGKMVMHLKLTILRVKENGVPWIYVFAGSHNFSNHEENAELQNFYRFPADSSIARGLIAAVEQLPKAFPNESVEPDTAILRKVIEKLLGQSIFDLPVKWVEEQLHLAQKKDFKTLEANLIARAEGKTQVAHPAPLELVKSRISKLIGFRDWYMKQPYKMDVMTPERLGVLALLILSLERQPISAFQVKKTLTSILWSPNATDEALDERAKEAWAELKIQAEFPKNKPVIAKVAGARHEDAPAPLAARREAAAAYLESDEGKKLGLTPLACGDAIAALGL